MKKIQFFIVTFFAVLFSWCENYALQSDNKSYKDFLADYKTLDWCKKLTVLETEELKKIRCFFDHVLMDHDETIGLSKSYLSAGFNHSKAEVVQLPKARKMVYELMELIEFERNSSKVPAGYSQKTFHDQIIVAYARGCLMQIDEELDARNVDIEALKNYKKEHFIDPFDYFRK